MILADKIITLRKKNGWSQEELAEKVGVSRQAISKWESAQSVPDLDKILRMSEIFGVTTDFLLKDEMEEETSGVIEEDFGENAEADRFVDLNEANAFMALEEKASLWVAAGVSI